MGGAGRLHAYVSGLFALRWCGIEDRIVPIGGWVAGHVMERVVHEHGRTVGATVERIVADPAVARREPGGGGGGAGDAEPSDPVPRVGSGERNGVRFCCRVPAKHQVSRVFGVSVRVLSLPRRTGSGQRRPGGRRCDPWPTPGRSGGRSGCMGRRRAAGRRPYSPGREKKLRLGNSGVREEPRTHDREVPCPAGSARSGRAFGTVDPYRRYLRYGTFKGPSSLRSRVGVCTVRLTWLIRPAAKLR